MVPVRQKVHPRAHPTWLDTQIVVWPSGSGPSFSSPPGKPSCPPAASSARRWMAESAGACGMSTVSTSIPSASRRSIFRVPSFDATVCTTGGSPASRAFTTSLDAAPRVVGTISPTPVPEPRIVVATSPGFNPCLSVLQTTLARPLPPRSSTNSSPSRERSRSSTPDLPRGALPRRARSSLSKAASTASTVDCATAEDTSRNETVGGRESAENPCAEGKRTRQTRSRSCGLVAILPAAS
mmetsp:Transcript_39283/g.87825  ORF Transcript_39283/g.87825 Transcript_39283/m.87825 type:complete len:239 (-) Transcript_39283:138-854(-)